MPLDGSFIACLRCELEAAIGCHIDKIHIPAKNEFVFALRGKNFNKKFGNVEVLKSINLGTMVTSVGIIIVQRNIPNTIPLPLKRIFAKA